MLESLTTKILVLLVLHWVNWRAQGNNCDYYSVCQGGEHKIPLFLSAVTIDIPGPNPSARDITPHCLWSLSRSDPYLIMDVNVVDISPARHYSRILAT